jgi:hypothetical protein
MKCHLIDCRLLAALSKSTGDKSLTLTVPKEVSLYAEGHREKAKAAINAAIKQALDRAFAGFQDAARPTSRYAPGASSASSTCASPSPPVFTFTLRTGGPPSPDSAARSSSPTSTPGAPV